jgi:hypothetical protein
MTTKNTMPASDSLPANGLDPRRTKTLAELAAEQGISGPQDFDALVGSGADLWNDDRDFENFLSSLHEARQNGK